MAAFCGAGRRRGELSRFNLSGEIPQVAALTGAGTAEYTAGFQSLRRDSSSGRGGADGTSCNADAEFQSLRRDSSSGRTFTADQGGTAYYMFQSLRRDSSSGRPTKVETKAGLFRSFNLSGEIPQVAAPRDDRVATGSGRFQSLRRDSSSGRLLCCPVGRRHITVSISQARFLKWPLALCPVLVPVHRLQFQSLRRDSSSGRISTLANRLKSNAFQSLRRDSSSGRD